MSEHPMLTPQEVLEQLRFLQERIPDFVLLSSAELRKIRRAGYEVNRDLARKAVDMANDSEVMREAIHRTPDELARAQEEAELWGDVEGALRLMVRGVTAGNAIRRRRIARLVQHTIRLGASMAENETGHDLAVHVERVRRIRKSQRGK